MQMRQQREQTGGDCYENWPCVLCVSGSLKSLAETTSVRELERANRRLGRSSEKNQGLIRTMARRVAERIVDPAIRGLLRASPFDRPRIVAEIRQTFGLQEPDGCPLNAQLDSQARGEALASACPQLSPSGRSARLPDPPGA
jgi:hypothetical protein